MTGVVGHDIKIPCPQSRGAAATQLSFIAIGPCMARLSIFSKEMPNLDFYRKFLNF